MQCLLMRTSFAKVAAADVSGQLYCESIMVGVKALDERVLVLIVYAGV